jgi:uncharacterized protein involved in tellurium resistance
MELACSSFRTYKGRVTSDPKEKRFEMRMSETERDMLRKLAKLAGESDAIVVRRLIREAFAQTKQKR